MILELQEKAVERDRVINQLRLKLGLTQTSVCQLLVNKAEEVDGKLLLIDFGVMFPDATMPGIDVVLPDNTWLKERSEDIVGLIVTHGHEDHLGGVTHLLRDVAIPLYGSELTMGLARHKVKEANLENRTSFHMHGSINEMPIDSILYFPNSQKAHDLVLETVNATKHVDEVIDLLEISS
mgnify:CR=1 FL=1